MQKIGLLFLLAILFTATSCSEDDFIMLTNTLHFDQDPFDSANVPAGTNELAIKLEETDMALHIGKQLKTVRFYGYNAPDNCVIKVYGEGSNGTPGSVLYTADVTADFNEFAWINHTLSAPIDLDGSDLWISIEVTHSNNLQTVGCDEGPSNAGGDWLYQSDDNQWLTYRSRTQRVLGEAVGVNWNIRGIVE